MKSLLPLFCFISFFSFSQQTGRIETDRPDQTECPYIVKKGYMQFEFGFNRNVESGISNLNLPSTLMKYGLHPRLELRYVGSLNQAGNLDFEHEAIGFKWALFENKGIRPKTSIIVHYHFEDKKRDLSDKNQQAHSIGQTVFTFQNELPNEWSLGYNLGTEVHENGELEGIYRIAPGKNLGKNGYLYLEFFGRYPSNASTDHWFDGGLAYYLSPNVKADVSAGKSFTSAQDWYLAVGLSIRFKLI